MRAGVRVAILLAGFATPCLAADSAATNIGDAIASYRLTARYCGWPITEKVGRVLSGDEAHFSGQDRQAFDTGVKNATDRFQFLTHSSADYCSDIKSSRDDLTHILEKRAK